MPAERSQLSRYVIPADVAPQGICCVSVPVPDDPQWRAMFLGALWRLTLQTHYERDEDKTGKVIAARWRDVYSEVRDSMGICTPSDRIIRAAINADFRLALNVEFTANGLDGIAPDRPDTFFDEDSADTGDEVTQRTNALCNACIDFVNTVADDAANVALAAGLTAFPTLAPIIMVLAPIAGAVYVGALLLVTLATIITLHNEDVRRKVACCMFDNLKGLAITEANFNASLTGCGFDALSDPEIVREIIEGGVNDRGDYLAFVSVLGSFFTAVGDAELDCACGLWVHQFDFRLGELGWTDRTEEARPFGVHVPGEGWSSEYNAGAEKLYMQIADFPSRDVIEIRWTMSAQGSEGTSRSFNTNTKLADVLQSTEEIGSWSVPQEHVFFWDGDETADEIEMSMVQNLGSDASQFVLRECKVTGRGTDPF